MKWTSEFPKIEGAGDVFYWTKRPFSKDVTLAGFSMGKMWVNGNFYEPSETTHLEFLGPVIPQHSEMFDELIEALRDARGWLDDSNGNDDLTERIRHTDALLNRAKQVEEA